MIFFCLNLIFYLVLLILLNIFSIHFDQSKVPGEELLKSLDKNGCTVQKYREFLNKALSTKLIRTYYRPVTKVAVLIANEKYQHLSKLVTPSIDCELLASSFKHLGFIIVTIKNSTSKDLKEILAKVFDLIPENSYCKYPGILLSYILTLCLYGHKGASVKPKLI